VSWTVCSREEGVELGHGREVRQKPRRGLSCEVTTVVYQMHLIVEVIIVGNAAPCMAGPSELVIEGSVEPNDSRVEFGGHAYLCEETPLELSF
jgi:hypothetical protein